MPLEFPGIEFDHPFGAPIANWAGAEAIVDYINTLEAAVAAAQPLTLLIAQVGEKTLYSDATLLSYWDSTTTPEALTPPLGGDFVARTERLVEMEFICPGVGCATVGRVPTLTLYLDGNPVDVAFFTQSVANGIHTVAMKATERVIAGTHTVEVRGQITGGADTAFFWAPALLIVREVQGVN